MKFLLFDGLRLQFTMAGNLEELQGLGCSGDGYQTKISRITFASH